jgi:hypothetical protein
MILRQSYTISGMAESERILLLFLYAQNIIEGKQECII